MCTMETQLLCVVNREAHGYRNESKLRKGLNIFGGNVSLSQCESSKIEIHADT